MKFKTTPRAHQLEVWNRAKDLEYFALLMEMGTGKTKVDIDCSAYSAQAGLINAWIVIAPSGVHLNWHRQELPKHWPDNIPYTSLAWDSGKARTKGGQRAIADFLASKKFPILCMNVDAVLTDAGVDILRELLRKRKCKLTIDESSIIKSYKAKRTKLLIKAGALAKQRRILNGTPITNGPLNLFSQCLFLDKRIFGYTSYHTFSHHYAEWKTERNWGQGRDYETLVEYRNIDELIRKLDAHSYRVLKQDCLDLPPKIYMPPRYVELTKEQRQAYGQLRDDFMLQLGDQIMTAPMAITRLLRLQQLICGYLPLEDGTLVRLNGPNPRVSALLSLLEETEPRKCIIWARFTEDIKQIKEALGGEYGPASIVTYDGTTSARDREYAKAQFQNNDSPVRFFVGNAAAGGRGVDLYVAESVIYFSNSFSLEQRLQSEDRAHRDGLKHSVAYHDLIAIDTVDEYIVEALRNGRNVADGILNQLKGWLK